MEFRRACNGLADGYLGVIRGGEGEGFFYLPPAGGEGIEGGGGGGRVETIIGS